MLQFLSEDWLAKLRSGLAPIRLDAGIAGRLGFETGELHWHLAIEGGRVTDLGRGPIAEPDVVVRWTDRDGRRILSRSLRGNEAYAATTVAAYDADGPYVGPPAPYNLGRRPELDAMPTIAGATLGVEYRYRRGPFGDVTYALSFRDGRLVDEQLAAPDAPDVVVDVTYRAMALVRAGAITILDALEDGGVTGELGPLGVLAGISESEEFHAAELATGPHAIALAALGELDADPGFAAAITQVFAETLDDAGTPPP
jgi:hypothetical protein